jgi:hypothetical protein
LTREPAHRGRGASAWGDSASAIFNIEHSQTDGTTLFCAKRKNGEEYEVTLHLDRETRWFTVTGSTLEAKPQSKRETVLRALTESAASVADIEKLLSGKVSRRTIQTHLDNLVRDGLATRPKFGHYATAQVRNLHKSLHSCTVSENGNESAQLCNPLYGLRSLHSLDEGELPDDFTIPAGVPDDKLQTYIDSQKIAGVA